VKLAEVLLLVTALVVPPVLGVVAARLQRAWWWAAALAVVLALIVMIAPQPEAGESRISAGDLPFVLLVALWVTGLVWLSNYLARRFWVRRQAKPRRAAEP
jgi:protein-S-isoprenylcysteine O-methyltransferase Ste14